MILVDDLRAYTTKAGRTTRWCHMVSTVSEDELHAFAARICLRRSWAQLRPRASAAHYDLRPTSRERALAAGAVAVSIRDLVTRNYHMPPSTNPDGMESATGQRFMFREWRRLVSDADVITGAILRSAELTCRVAHAARVLLRDARLLELTDGRGEARALASKLEELDAELSVVEKSGDRTVRFARAACRASGSARLDAACENIEVASRDHRLRMSRGRGAGSPPQIGCSCGWSPNPRDRDPEEAVVSHMASYMQSGDR